MAADDVTAAEAGPFAGGGEVRALARALDWGATPLGPAGAWPGSLRTVARTVLATAFPAILLWGPELVQLYNDAYRVLMGGKHPGGLGQPTRECWPEVWHLTRPTYERVLAGETVTVEDALYPVDRFGYVEDLYFTMSFSPVPDDAGGVGGVLVLLFERSREVAERRHGAEVERLLHELGVERARMEYVFRQAPTFLAVLRGPGHVFEIANEAYYDLVGRRDIVGRSVGEALPEVVQQGFVELLDRVLATGEPFLGREVPARLARTPGAPPEERFIDLTYMPLVEADGTRSGVVAHGSDVTEQVVARREVERLLRESEEARRALDAANAALRASETRLRDVFEQAPVAVAVLTGPDHVYSIVSPRYAETPGGGRRLLGQPLREAFPEIEGQGYAEIVDRVYETGEPFFAAERLVRLDRDRDGIPEDYVFDLGYQPLRDLEGRVYAVASVAMDVTEQVRARREVDAAREAAEAARAEAEAANRSKAEFLATMSHELRTPLNAIGGYAELIELGIHGPVTPAQREALERIQTSQRHLLGLINEVLNYSRVEAGVVRYDLEDVPVAEALAACQVLTAPQMRAKRLAIGGADPPPGLAARADREKLQQILLNLLSNAAKFTGPGGAVTLSAGVQDGRVAIRVSDTGRGIPAERLEHVFEPFVQVDARLTRTQEGVGLGLAISRDLARGMGGDLFVESVVGAGSTFTLVLPRAG